IDSYGSAGNLLLAVADGHGSAKCFRSDYGSRFAVEAAKSVLSAPGPLDTEELPSEIVRRWRQSVRDHLSAEPFLNVQLLALEHKLGIDARRSVESDPVLAYGSTLLAAVVSDSSVCYLQLGDGDILAVSGSAEVTRPWPRDGDQLGDETAS